MGDAWSSAVDDFSLWRGAGEESTRRSGERGKGQAERAPTEEKKSSWTKVDSTLAERKKAETQEHPYTATEEFQKGHGHAHTSTNLGQENKAGFKRAKTGSGSHMSASSGRDAVAHSKGKIISEAGNTEQTPCMFGFDDEELLERLMVPTSVMKSSMSTGNTQRGRKRKTRATDDELLGKVSASEERVALKPSCLSQANPRRPFDCEASSRDRLHINPSSSPSARQTSHVGIQKQSWTNQTRLSFKPVIQDGAAQRPIHSTHSSSTGHTTDFDIHPASSSISAPSTSEFSCRADPMTSSFESMRPRSLWECEVSEHGIRRLDDMMKQVSSQQLAFSQPAFYSRRPNEAEVHRCEGVDDRRTHLYGDAFTVDEEQEGKRMRKQLKATFMPEDGEWATILRRRNSLSRGVKSGNRGGISGLFHFSQPKDLPKTPPLGAAMNRPFSRTIGGVRRAASSTMQIIAGLSKGLSRIDDHTSRAEEVAKPSPSLPTRKRECLTLRDTDASGIAWASETCTQGDVDHISISDDSVHSDYLWRDDRS